MYGFHPRIQDAPRERRSVEIEQRFRVRDERGDGEEARRERARRGETRTDEFLFEDAVGAPWPRSAIEIAGDGGKHDDVLHCSRRTFHVVPKFRVTWKRLIT